MRTTKKWVSMILAAILIMAWGTAAFAADETQTDTITISVNTAGQSQTDQNSTSETYTAYKIFDVTKVSAVAEPVTSDNTVGQTVNSSTSTGFAYSISNTSEWWSVLITADTALSYTVSTDSTTGVITTTYFTFTPAADGSGKYAVKLADGVEGNEATALKVAELLNKNITGKTGTSFDAASALSTLPGYYLITSSLGSNLILATTNIAIKEKNSYPSSDKKVLDLDADDAEAAETTASIGEDVTFELVVNIPDEAIQELVIHDTMSAGLTLDLSSFSMTIAATGAEPGTETTVATDNYSVVYKTGLPVKGTAAGNVSSGTLSDTCSFEVVIPDTYIQSLAADSTVVVTYKAELNQSAVISTGSNTNKAHITYSNYTTPDTEVSVNTFEFDLRKTDPSDKDLLGAQFEMYKGTVADANKVSFVKTGDATTNVYRVADSAQSASNVVTTIDLTALASANIEGVGNGTYILREIKTPDGYNTLADDITVTISDSNRLGTDGFKVVNSTGTLLPSTGGIGTTIFYVIGGILVVLAGVLLVSKRRMNSEDK